MSCAVGLVVMGTMVYRDDNDDDDSNTGVISVMIIVTAAVVLVPLLLLSLKHWLTEWNQTENRIFSLSNKLLNRYLFHCRLGLTKECQQKRMHEADEEISYVANHEPQRCHSQSFSVPTDRTIKL